MQWDSKMQLDKTLVDKKKKLKKMKKKENVRK
jgi:hypothetical protein